MLIQKLRRRWWFTRRTRGLSQQCRRPNFARADRKSVLGRRPIDPAWHFFREDGTLMPPEEYPVNQVLATRQPVETKCSNCIVRPRPERVGSWSMHPVLGRENEISEVIVTSLTSRARAGAGRTQLPRLHRGVLGRRDHRQDLGRTDHQLEPGANESTATPLRKILDTPFATVPNGLMAELAGIMESLKHGKVVEHLETTRVRKDGQTIQSP